MKREVFFPPVGIVHITNNITDLIKYKLKGKNKVIINTSAQPNSSPHLGTITTIMSCFALAKHIKTTLNIDSEIQFDELENSPCEKVEYDGVLYYRDQKHSYNENGKTFEEINMNGFKEILDAISEYSNVNYTIRTYNDFQKNTSVRKAVIDIVNDKEFFKELLFPSTNELHIRSLCPECGLGRKEINDLDLSLEDDIITLKEQCPIHGEYTTVIKSDNSDYVDINTQFRDLTKGIAITDEDKQNNTLTIMLDGGDWGGTWSQRIHTEGMVRLGYNDFPIRLYAPVILDWSGAKFSKSLYLKENSYKDINQAFVNYDNFKRIYTEKGLFKLWQEVESWISEPKRFFRNYTVDYFMEVMEGGCNE